MFELTVDVHREEDEGVSEDILDVDPDGSVLTDIAAEARDDISRFTKIEQVIWNLQWAVTVY